MATMNDIVIGRSLRILRLRHQLRQADVADRAGVSQQLISKIERGRLASVSTAVLRRVFAAVEADVVTLVRWRAGELDRLLDEGHAELVGRIVVLLQRRGWQVLTEATFSEFGERGSIDILAWHAATRTLLVIEVKTEITSAEETLRRHDVKVRLAPRIGLERFGAKPARVGRLLVVADDMRNRRRVKRLEPVLAGAYPVRGRAVRAWIAAPDGDLRALIFTAPAEGRRSPRRPRRVHRPSDEAAAA
jgi:transcriptional regulator with XRE-family HTH domain